MVVPPTTRGVHWFETAVNEALILNLNNAVQVGGFLTYLEEA